MFYRRDIPSPSSWPTCRRRPPTRPSRSSTPRRAVPARGLGAVGLRLLATPTQTPVSLSQAAGAPVESSGARPRLRVMTVVVLPKRRVDGVPRRLPRHRRDVAP